MKFGLNFINEGIKYNCYFMNRSYWSFIDLTNTHFYIANGINYNKFI